MFVQTEITPNPNSLKFIPGKAVSNAGSFEITKKDEIKNQPKVNHNCNILTCSLDLFDLKSQSKIFYMK